MGSKVLSLSKDEYAALGGLLTGQDVTLKVTGKVLDATDRMVTLGVKSITVSNKSSNDQSVSTTPAAIAGVGRRLLDFKLGHYPRLRNSLFLWQPPGESAIIRSEFASNESGRAAVG